MAVRQWLHGRTPKCQALTKELVAPGWVYAWSSRLYECHACAEAIRGACQHRKRDKRYRQGGPTLPRWHGVQARQTDHAQGYQWSLLPCRKPSVSTSVAKAITNAIQRPRGPKMTSR